MKHYSKVDAWVGILIIGVIGITLFTVLIIPPEEQWIGLIVFIPTSVFMLSFLLNTYYVFEDEYLLCMLGFFPQKIRYDNIKSIKKVRNMLSSAALSSDRIEIKEKNKNYFVGTTYISPKDKDDFFEELRTRCPKTIEVL
ncbi:MAG: PH domain-containing protein [Erysipelothrix sp.]|jgi:hypothetical protein|nr:PH domain-containing protein [Erysipelothrix sp.]